MVLLNAFQQLILSGIIIVWTLIQLKLIFKKGKYCSIKKEFEKWKSSKNDFISFKNYQYDKTFWLVIFENSYTIFSIGLLISLKDVIINLFGFYPWIAAILCSFYILARFTKELVPKAINKSIDNMKILYEEIN